MNLPFPFPDRPLEGRGNGNGKQHVLSQKSAFGHHVLSHAAIELVFLASGKG